MATRRGWKKLHALIKKRSCSSNTVSCGWMRVPPRDAKSSEFWREAIRVDFYVVLLIFKLVDFFFNRPNKTHVWGTLRLWFHICNFWMKSLGLPSAWGFWDTWPWTSLSCFVAGCSFSAVPSPSQENQRFSCKHFAVLTPVLIADLLGRHCHPQFLY